MSGYDLAGLLVAAALLVYLVTALLHADRSR
ncbi:K(+)-transporting ATPase subunit F [Cellulomonas edaphi]|uniref:K(+)-transporting ATPase subunit F n=1 Tax=Cellulomonas edaphi TaxID=3053468 RepID=A0ABT7S732_9CELL|nr:K(+)-transporting ATPase subunit F [Cellulomons edaphi]MDM7831324.1 K(+)-transporting ATPase subunit F [Cellulomons edaphi]